MKKCRCGKPIPKDRRKWCSRRCIKTWWYRDRNGLTLDSMSETHTYKGRRAELLALKLLPGSKDLNYPLFCAPHDIEWKGKKINVKSCEQFNGGWVFNGSVSKPDFYFCLCLIGGKLARAFMIPSERLGNGITIGQKTKKFAEFLFKI